MKLAVFGGTGRIGSHVVRLAVERGHQVRALARNSSKIPTELAAHVEVVDGAVTDAARHPVAYFKRTYRSWPPEPAAA